MKILVVSQYFRPDITAAAFRIAETVDLLAEAGHDLTVVTTEPHRAQARAQTEAGSRSSADASLSDASPSTGPNVHRVPIDPLDGSGMRPYLRHFFSFVFRARRRIRRLLRGGYRPDVIWVSSPPLFVGLVGTAAARWSGAPLVLDIRDVWPDTAVAAGQISRDGRAYQLGRRLERWLYRKARAITCVAEPMAAYVREQLSYDSARNDTPVAVVYNGAGFAVRQPVPPEELRKTVLYAGNLGRLQGIDALLNAWTAVRRHSRETDDHPARDWTLEIIGGGVLETELRDTAISLGIADAVVFRGVMPKDETVVEMRRAGVLFLNLIPNPVFDLTIPSKLFDYLATARPVVGGITGEGGKLLAQLPGNRAVTPSNSAEIAAALSSVIEGGDWDQPCRENQRAVTDRYSRSVNAHRLETLLQSVVT